VALLKKPSEVMGFIPHLRTVDISPGLRNVISDTYKSCIHVTWYVLAEFGTVEFLTTLLVEEFIIETVELGRQHFEHETGRAECD
jgi:hypothetical protein